MKARLIVVAAVTIAGAMASPSFAAKPPAKVCKLVTDTTNDTFAARSQDGEKKYGPQEDGFDITSADIATDLKTITAVIRVKKLTTSIQTSPTGVAFGFDFTFPAAPTGTTGSLRAIVFNGGAPYYEAALKTAVPSGLQNYSTFLGAVTGVWDTAHNEVHISAPVSLFSDLGPLKKGATVAYADDSAAQSGRPTPLVPGQVGKPIPSRFAFADVAVGGKPYKAGTPSCVTPGK